MTTRHVFSAALVLFASRASAQATVTISNPPPSAAASSSISVTETVWNAGTSATGGATQTLSLVPVSGGATLLLGTRSIPGLQGGALSTVTTNVTIPASTPSGTYRIGAGNAGCTGNCLKSAGTITIISNTPQVTVTVYVNGPGKVSGGLEGNVFHQPYFQNCNTPAPFGCVTSGNPGDAFVLTAIPGTVPGGPFGQSHAATFTGWSGAGCVGTPQGSYGLRVVATSSISCTARFQ
jgi:hypothetical protein